VPHVLRLSSIAEGFPLVVDRHIGHAPTGLHGHDFTELVVILGGRGIHFMRTLADDMLFACGPTGTRVLLVKRLH
jgi:hypothetical protein